MLNRKCWMLIFFALLFSCDKDSPTETKATVNISEITCDKTTVTVEDTVKFECVASSSGTLHYHWDLVQGTTSYESSIIERANTSSSFDFGRWIKWLPPSHGTWEISVLAYLGEADHSSAGTGSWHIFYEYDSSNQLIRRHCFNYAEKGELWDERSISMMVEN